MRKDQIRSPEQACTYLMDCVMATVDDLSMTKSRTKSYYQPQLRFAQQVLESMKHLFISLEHTRADKVENDHNGSVLSYAQEIENRFNIKPFKSLDLSCKSPVNSLLELLIAHRDHALLSSEITKIKHEKERQLSLASFAQEWITYLEKQ